MSEYKNLEIITIDNKLEAECICELINEKPYLRKIGEKEILNYTVNDCDIKMDSVSISISGQYEKVISLLQNSSITIDNCKINIYEQWILAKSMNSNNLSEDIGTFYYSRKERFIFVITKNNDFITLGIKEDS